MITLLYLLPFLVVIGFTVSERYEGGGYKSIKPVSFSGQLLSSLFVATVCGIFLRNTAYQTVTETEMPNVFLLISWLTAIVMPPLSLADWHFVATNYRGVTLLDPTDSQILARRPMMLFYVIGLITFATYMNASPKSNWLLTIGLLASVSTLFLSIFGLTIRYRIGYNQPINESLCPINPKKIKFFCE